MFAYIEKQVLCTGIQPNYTVLTFDLFLPYSCARESLPSMGFTPKLEPNSYFTGKKDIGQYKYVHVLRKAKLI